MRQTSKRGNFDVIWATLMSVGAFIYLYLKLTKSKKNNKLHCNSKFSATTFLGVLCFFTSGVYIYIYYSNVCCFCCNMFYDCRESVSE